MITKEDFRKKNVREGIATWRVEVNLYQIQNGINAMNELACDDSVESGYLLEDITYEPVGVTKKKGTEEPTIIIKCVANAQNWLVEAFEEDK